MKENIEPGTAIIHVDYSESYRNKQQDKIQSAYFGQTSFSIFTACVYHKTNNGADTVVKRPMTIISESSNHSRIASMPCIHMIVEEIFKFLSSYRTDLIIEWNYNEAHHGKGPMDGIGGTIKNVVYRKVKTGKVIFNSAEEFHEAANKFIPSIKSLFQTAVERASRY